MRIFRQLFFRQSRRLLPLALALFLSACAYKIEIRQGNDLLVKNIEKLQTGMTKADVTALLGGSLTPSVFREDIWLYTYQIRNSGFAGATKLIAVELVFAGDELVAINRLKDDYQTNTKGVEATKDVAADEANGESEH